MSEAASSSSAHPTPPPTVPANPYSSTTSSVNPYSKAASSLASPPTIPPTNGTDHSDGDVDTALLSDSRRSQPQIKSVPSCTGSLTSQRSAILTPSALDAARSTPSSSDTPAPTPVLSAPESPPETAPEASSSPAPDLMSIGVPTDSMGLHESGSAMSMGIPTDSAFGVPSTTATTTAEGQEPDEAPSTAPRLLDSVMALGLPSAPANTLSDGDLAELEALREEVTRLRAAPQARVGTPDPVIQECLKEMRALAPLIRDSAATKSDVSKMKAQLAEVRKDFVTKSEFKLGLAAQSSATAALKDASTKSSDKLLNKIAAVGTASARNDSALADSLAALDTKVSGIAKSSADVIRDTLDAHLPAATAAAVNASVQTAFATAFSSSIVPAFESVMRELFTQVNTTLSTGLAEHLSHAAGLSVSVAKRLEASAAEIKTAAEAAVQASRTSTEKSEKDCSTAVHSNDGQAQSNTPLVPTSKRVKSKAKGNKDTAQVGPASMSVPPSEEPHVPTASTLQANRADSPPLHTFVTAAEDDLAEDSALTVPFELLQLLESKRFADAFCMALDKGDADLAAWLCAQVRPAVCVSLLGERLLLPLMQQLSVNMSPSEVTLESSLEWIQEAINTLDPESSEYRDNMPMVLHEVNEAIKTVSRQATDRAIAQKAAVTGRVVVSKLRSLDK